MELVWYCQALRQRGRLRAEVGLGRRLRQQPTGRRGLAEGSLPSGEGLWRMRLEVWQRK